VVGIYRPTYHNSDYATSVCDSRKLPDKPVWITEDINFLDNQWKMNTVTKHQYTKQTNEHFLVTFSMLGLCQMATFQKALDNNL